MKKNITIIVLSVITIISLVFGISTKLEENNVKKSYKLNKLPKPEVTGGQRGALGIDKNINEKTIDNYLEREDSVYYDMRMLKDDANWEKIGGDSYLSGFVKGFEVFPYPFIADDSINSELSNKVGDGYKGESLYKNVNGKYKPNYKESLEILEYLFPKDKNIFLMCGGGGYAGQTKKLLISLGWNKNKIYDVGGYWYYEGKNKVNVKETRDKKTTYDFWKVKYHNIDFDSLTKIED